MVSARSLGFLSTILLAATAFGGDPIRSWDVKCGDVLLGTMKLDKYGAWKDDFVLKDKEFGKGGVEISGAFTKKKGNQFHYIQSIVADNSPKTDDFDFRAMDKDGNALTAPWVDTPPGGYKGSAFDYAVYYDNIDSDVGKVDFPDFYDKPNIVLFAAGASDKKKVTVKFETWLVGTVYEKPAGKIPKKGTDIEYYCVAPLIGWSWGYEIEWTGESAEDLVNVAKYKVTALGLSTDALTTPTADWKKSLDYVYGTGDNKDKFVVKLKSCEDFLAPEPSTYALGALAAVGLMRRRRMRVIRLS